MGFNQSLSKDQGNSLVVQWLKSGPSPLHTHTRPIGFVSLENPDCQEGTRDSRDVRAGGRHDTLTLQSGKVNGL